MTPSSVQLPATATLAQASALAMDIERAAAGEPGGTPLQLDASALEAFDTSLLAVLLHARRLAMAAGRPFSVTGAPAKLGLLARLYGVDELLGIAAAA